MGTIVARWRPRLRPILGRNTRLTVEVIFTHQTPLVTWPPTVGTFTCELADLLIAFVDRTSSKQKGRAILIQGKQSDKQKLTLVSPSEKKQFQLLSTRPVFDLVAKGSPKNVDLVSHQPDVGLMYGLTPPDGQPANPKTWPRTRWHSADGLQSTTGSGVFAGDDLAATLVNLLQGQKGWSFDLPPVTADWTHFASAKYRDDWSMLINHLLKRTFARKPRVLVAGGGSGRRHEQYCCLWLPSEVDLPLGFGLFYDDIAHVPHRAVAESVREGIGPSFARYVLGHAFEDGGDQHVERRGETTGDDGPISAIVFSLSDEEGQSE